MKDLTPQQIVRELDRYIVGQAEAKRAVAIALRNRYRRLALPAELQAEITPKNILMMGPTGVGKTEIARRLARLADSPFVKVEATKFTQVGYVGRDVESIVRDLMDTAVTMTHERRVSEVTERATQAAEDRIIDILTEKAVAEATEVTESADSADTSDSADKPGRADRTAARSATRGGRSKASATPAVATSGSAVTSAPAAKATGGRVTRRAKAQARKAVAERMARNELDEQIIEIELDAEEGGGYPSMFEFVAGISNDEMSDGFQELLTGVPTSRRRMRSVSVKEARRLLTQEEANKLIDFEEVVENATQRVEQAGVIFLDEIDKIVGSKVDTGPDVSGEGVQRDLLPIVEGSSVMTRFGPVKTDHILWIAAGAFHNAKPSDLIPELQGRLPLRVELSALRREDYERILMEPENALTKQYTALMQVDGVELNFTEDGLKELAACAWRMNERAENIGARRLHTIMERVLEEVSFQGPDIAGQTVTVDATFVRDRLGPLMQDEDLSRYIL